MSEGFETSREPQNRLSEQEFQYKRSEQVQTTLYEIADAASAATDMQAFYTRLHAIIGRLMYARNFYVAVYEADTGMMKWPYHVDERDTEIWEPEPLAR